MGLAVGGDTGHLLSFASLSSVKWRRLCLMMKGVWGYAGHTANGEPNLWER